jgi:Xaa-Pro aminopeptidase
MVDLSTLAPMDVPARAASLQAALAGQGCDGMLVSHLTNIRYLTGFTGSAALLVVLEEELVLVTDGRYEEQAAAELAASRAPARISVGRTLDEQQSHVVAALARARRVGLEADHVSWSDQRRYAATWFPDADLVPVSGVIEGQRAVKDDGEVARIEAACSIADDALANVVGLLDDGPTEAAFALTLDAEMRRLGADGTSFETIVASGPNGSRPHHAPGSRAVARGDLVVIDFGALVDGYHSDMTRTVPVGGVEVLAPEQRRMLEVVTAAQAAGVAAVRSGATGAAVDAACREVIAEAGWAEAFVHGTGHGVGLDIHEEPRVNGSSAATLTDGHIVTVEPGVYLPGLGGVRVEDTVVVTSDGCRPLTHAPKPLAPI